MAQRDAPRGTGPAGRKLWDSVAAVFDLEPHEFVVLEQLSVIADRVKELDKAVARDGVLLGDRAHPALIESRLQRLALGRLLATLRLPDREEIRPQRRGGFRRPYAVRGVGDGA
jgi:hypothetical protein